MAAGFGGGGLSAAADRFRRGPRGSAADCRTGAGLRRRFRPRLAPGGPVVRRTLGTQLGHGRLYRPREPDRACPSPGGRRRRPQSAARVVRRPARRLQSLFAEQPAVSQRALHRCRKTSGIPRRPGAEGGAGALAGVRRRRLPGRGGPEMAGLARGVRRLQGRSDAGTATGFRKIPRRARALAVALCLFRSVPAQIQDTLVGMAGRVARRRTTAGAPASAKGPTPPKSRSSNSCNGTPTGSLPPARRTRTGSA